jgi:RNA polymerase sigma-70 factor (ECF subfamily)
MSDANSESSFNRLLPRLRSGDDRAAAELFQRYASRLVAYAQARISGRIQQKMGAEDIAQSVLITLFQRLQRGEFDLRSWDDLSDRTVHRIIDKARQRLATELADSQLDV